MQVDTHRLYNGHTVFAKTIKIAQKPPRLNLQTLNTKMNRYNLTSVHVPYLSWLCVCACNFSAHKALKELNDTVELLQEPLNMDTYL